MWIILFANAMLQTKTLILLFTKTLVLFTNRKFYFLLCMYGYAAKNKVSSVRCANLQMKIIDGILSLVWHWSLDCLLTKVVTVQLWTCDTISGTNYQNTFPLHLVKLRNRALKFLVHFSLVCLAKYPKAHEKWSQMGKANLGIHFPPSFRHALEAI